MKTRSWNYSIVMMGLSLLLMISCSKGGGSDNNNPPSSNGTVTDVDGNVYHTVTIGTQVWMVENLKTTKLNDGTPIPLVTDVTFWHNLGTPGYCWYNNDITYKNNYGALYNWFTVNTGKLAPTGWHVPTYTEWETLIAYLGGESVAGGKMKEIGTTHWKSPNTGATNESGFSAIPSGMRTTWGAYGDLGNFNLWWTVSTYSSSESMSQDVGYSVTSIRSDFYSNTSGLTVRCLKN